MKCFIGELSVFWIALNTYLSITTLTASSSFFLHPHPIPRSPLCSSHCSPLHYSYEGTKCRALFSQLLPVQQHSQPSTCQWLLSQRTRRWRCARLCATSPLALSVRRSRPLAATTPLTMTATEGESGRSLPNPRLKADSLTAFHSQAQAQAARAQRVCATSSKPLSR